MENYGRRRLHYVVHALKGHRAASEQLHAVVRHISAGALAYANS